MIEQVRFHIGHTGQDAAGHYCMVTGPVFSSDKKIYGETSEEAQKNAAKFIEVMSATFPVTVKAAMGASLAITGPIAGATAVSDGPLPFGDILGAGIILAGLTYATYESINRRTQADEAACESQHQRDTRVCNSLPDPAKRAVCHGQASLRFANCLRGLPLPPLNF